MKLPIQNTLRVQPANWSASFDVTEETGGEVRSGGIMPSSCCDGSVTIYSPQGQQLYHGSSGCCYDAGQAYCYPCSGMEERWQTYAQQHFSQCTSTPPQCSISLTGCGSLTPYC